MKYIISNQYGRNIAVGLLDKDTAAEDINLSHNIHNIHVNNNYYNGILSFPSYARFLRYLINKEYLRVWAPNKSFREILSESKQSVRKIIKEQIIFDNYIPQIYQHEKAQAHVYRVHRYQTNKNDNE